MFKRKYVSETPFRQDMLPHNRKEMWVDVVKLHYVEFILLGLIMFVFCLPMILNIMLTDIYTLQLSKNLSDAALETQWAGILESLAVANNTSSIVNIPILVIASVGLSGLLRVIRQYAWGENVSPFHDFSVGIKQNGKQTALLAFITGVIYGLCVYLNTLAEINDNAVVSCASSALTAVALLFLLPIGAYMLVCISVYGNTFMQNLMQSFYLYMRTLWKTLWALACCGAIFLLYLIPSMAVHFAISLIFVLGSPFVLLGWFLFVYNQLDKFINKEKHPDIVNKGIYVDESPR